MNGVVSGEAGGGAVDLGRLEVWLRALIRQLVAEVLAEHGALPRDASTAAPAAAAPSLSAQGVYTVQELASLLKTTPKAVFARASRGQIPGVFRVGRSLRFRGRELVAWLLEGRALSSRGERR